MTKHNIYAGISLLLREVVDIFGQCNKSAHYTLIRGSMIAIEIPLFLGKEMLIIHRISLPIRIRGWRPFWFGFPFENCGAGAGGLWGA